MPLRSPDQYRASLRDGRAVFFRGEPVPDVTTHSTIGIAVDHACLDYSMAEDPAYRGLATVTYDDAEGVYSRYYKLPRSTEDLLRRSQLIEAATSLGNTLVVLVKEIGTDALFALHLIAHRTDAALGTRYLPRVEAFYGHCRDEDLALAVAQTDMKGDRSKGPSEQDRPDYYLRIVDERPDSIVVRGAKVHTSVSPNANELIVLPTRAMTEADRDFAVAFALPVNTPGVKLLASPFGAHDTPRSEFDFPITARHKMMETLTVFDDVVVPLDRVFLCGEWQYAGPLALAFVEFHRFTAISYKLPLVDALVGAAQLMADYNGIARAAHVRDKIIQLITYAETLRGLTHHAALKAQTVELGLTVPDALTVNMAKYHFANRYHEAVRNVQDIAGGLLVTGPSVEDLESEETRRYVERYFGGRAGVDSAERLRAMNFVKDLTASDYGGYQEVLAVHAEGSLEAEKLMIARSYDASRTLALVRRMAGIDAGSDNG
ncbi:MAG TPA: 4-hydroxyphenylacetate 3-hydroxylase N-terminal domain-containing protein [Dehalococcoidia bacterium]|nr:4-hydroxyphenylacetate 3-hydroxylase N-terminal domain-containing protein [Dehalococcoidia bacterium]